MKKPNPKNYDFLWQVLNTTYFFTSFWLCGDHLKRDFIITCEDDKWRVFVSKKERKKLSKYGLLFFKNYFNKYKKEVKDFNNKAKKMFRLKTVSELSKLSNDELKDDFLRLIIFIQQGWQLYWYTEYFFYDEIEQKIKENPIRNRSLIKKIQEMRKLKFNLRKKSLNKTQSLKGVYVFKPYFKEIKKRTGRNDLDSLHYEEISSLLMGKKVKKPNRKNWVWGKFNNWQPILGKKALAIIKSFNKELIVDKKVKILEGKIANRGYHKGKVRIIHLDDNVDLAKESSKLKKGEILVTGSTVPQMIIACRKAGAVVAEEGGIASHAAIVSRELNKPCIIGIKFATQVLKNGDLVEVDANKGIVKKLG